MATATGLFSSGSANYAITIVGSGISATTFKIEGDVIQQTGTQTRDVADIFEPVRGTQLRFQIRNNGLYQEIVDSKQFETTVTLTDTGSGQVLFTGYIQSNNVEVNRYWDNSEYTVTATDGLGLLEQLPYQLDEVTTLSGFLVYCLEPLEIISDILYVASWQEATMPNARPDYIRFDASLINAESRLEALRIVLRRFNLILSQSAKRSGVIEWKVVERAEVGLDVNGWSIDVGTGAVSSVTGLDDSNTLTDSDIVAEHLEGKMDAVEKVATRFTWNTKEPFVLNPNFAEWNTALDKPKNWNVIQGAVSRYEELDNSYSAVATTNSRLRQKMNVVKAPNKTFEIEFTLEGAHNGTTSIGAETFRMAQVAFLDPNGVDAPLYLANDGSVSTNSSTILTFEREINTTFFTIGETKKFVMNPVGNVFLNSKVVEITFYLWVTNDAGTTTYFDDIRAQNVTVTMDESAFANELVTQIDSGTLGRAIEQTFPIGQQNVYNARGSIEVTGNGSAWVFGDDWGSGQAFDTVYTRSLNSQTKEPVKYFKLKTVPSYGMNTAFSDGYVYGGLVYVPVYMLKNYYKETANFQIVRKEDLAPNSVTTQFAIEGDGTGFRVVEVEDILRVTDVSGDVTTTNADTDIIVEWANIDVYYSDDTVVSPADGLYVWQILERDGAPAPTVVFYLDRLAGTVQTMLLSAWQGSAQSQNEADFPELWRITQNTNVQGVEQPSAPKLSFKGRDYSQELFADTDADTEADNAEAVGDTRGRPLFAVGIDYADDTNLLIASDGLRPRVNIPSGSHLMIIEGTERFYVTTSADVDAGSALVPIELTFLEISSGAKVFFDDSFIGGQLLVRPSRVLLQAQSAQNDATSALNLSAENGVAVAELNAVVYGENGLGNSAGLLFDVNRNSATGVLKVNAEGEIALVQLDADPSGASAINIKADQVTVTADQTVFLNAIAEQIRLGNADVPLGNIVITSPTAPTQRPNGDDLVDGDLWYDSSNGNLPYTRVSGAWERNYVSIDGGLLEAGTVEADSLNINQAFIDAIFTRSITISGGALRAVDSNNSGTYVELNQNGLFGFLNGTETFAVPLVGTPRFSGEITNTTVDISTSVLQTSENVSADGGVIVNSAGIRAFATNGDETFNVNAGNGNVFVKGNIVADSGVINLIDFAGGQFNDNGINLEIKNTFNPQAKISWRTGNLETGTEQCYIGAERSFIGSNDLEYGATTHRFFETNNPVGAPTPVKSANVYSINATNGRTTVGSNGAPAGTIWGSGSTPRMAFSGYHIGFYLSASGNNGVSATVSNPTSITVENGIITAIS